MDNKIGDRDLDELRVGFRLVNICGLKFESQKSDAIALQAGCAVILETAEEALADKTALLPCRGIRRSNLSATLPYCAVWARAYYEVSRV